VMVAGAGFEPATFGL